MKQQLSFFLITDPHYYSHRLGTTGEAFERRKAEDQVVLPESGAILDAAIDHMLADRETEIVLIPGDLINNGEYVCHEELLQKLARLRDGGKRIFVTTATHDFTGDEQCENCFRAEGFEGDHRIPVRGTKRDELRALYYAYGRQQALSVHEPSMSYAVRLADGYRLLALNDDGNGRSFCGYDEDCLRWILGQVREARAAGEFVFAMTHHPILPPIPIYPLISKRDMLGDYETVWETFADAGLSFFFTGHTHVQDIAVKQTARGNKLYDVATGALVGYPSPIRKVLIDGGTVRVTTEHAVTFEWEEKRIDTVEFLKNKIDSLIYDAIDAAAHDHEHLAEIANGISIPREVIEQNAGIITLIGGILNESTVGELSALVGSEADVAAIAGKPVKELLAEVFHNIYGGDECFSAETSEYQAVMGIVARIQPVAESFGMHIDPNASFLQQLPALLDGVLCDAPPADNDAALPIEALREA